MSLPRNKIKSAAREVLAFCEGEGIEPCVERTGSGHYKFSLVVRGKARYFIVAMTPRCPHAQKNAIGEIKRWLRSLTENAT